MKWIIGFMIAAWLALGVAFMYRTVTYNELKKQHEALTIESQELLNETDRLNREAEQLSKEIEQLTKEQATLDEKEKKDG